MATVVVQSRMPCRSRRAIAEVKVSILAPTGKRPQPIDRQHGKPQLDPPEELQQPIPRARRNANRKEMERKRRNCGRKQEEHGCELRAAKP